MNMWCVLQYYIMNDIRIKFNRRVEYFVTTVALPIVQQCQYSFITYYISGQLHAKNTIFGSVNH